MAVVKLSNDNRTLEDPQEISAFLSQYGIWYRRFEGNVSLGDDVDAETVLGAYRKPIETLKREGGYTTADVIDVSADTPGIDAMLAKFSKEHWHDEDEVRFIVAGRGIFHIHPEGAPVFGIEVVEGDMINVPRGTHHWFDLCEESRIRAIRLFQDKSGWTPHYTDSGEETKHDPVCFGPSYLPPAASR